MRIICLVLALAAVPAAAAPTFLENATALLDEGRFADADRLAQEALEIRADDPDALVVAGTALLYRKAEFRRDESIYRPGTSPQAEAEAFVPPEVALEVAEYWKRVPPLDPARSYLWGDLAQMVFQSGAATQALEFAQGALDCPVADEGSLKASASVFALNLEWAKAARCLARIPGNRTAVLYQGLEAWRTGKENWRALLTSFVQSPGDEPAGAKLAAYLIGPAMRDGETGFQAALQVEAGIASLAIRQKYVDRYPDRFVARLELARSLSLYGSYDKALFHFSEIDRKRLTASADERQTVLFQQAWALTASGKRAEGLRLWRMLTDSRDFYTRSAALWFVGSDAVRAGKSTEAKALWEVRPEAPRRVGSNGPVEYAPSVLEEAGRSKYASWVAEAYRSLR